MKKSEMDAKSKEALQGLMEKGYTLQEILVAIEQLKKREQNQTRDSDA